MTDVETRLEDVASVLESTPVGAAHWPVRCVVFAAREAARRRWPGLPRAATPEGGRGATGRGWDEPSCRIGGAAEFVEIASHCAWGDEPVIRGSPRRLEGALPPAEATGFATGQLRDRARWNRTLGGLDWAPRPLDPDEEIDWILAEDALSGRPIPVPADAVLLGRTEAGDPRAAAVADGNGCAVGRSHAEARARALLELVERDATARWWRGLAPCRRLAPETCPGGAEAAAVLRAERRTLLLLDISSDLGVPTVAALIHGPEGRHFAVGFAAAPDPGTAAASAVSEAFQMEALVRFALETGTAPRPGLQAWLECATLARTPALRAAARAEEGPPPLAMTDASDAALARRIAARAGGPVVLLDRTRPEFGVPVWRALAPALCHSKPRLGPARARPPEPEEALAALERGEEAALPLAL